MVVYGLVGLLVSAAVLLTGVRVLFAAAPALTGAVERMVGEQLGVELRIGGLDARLQGLHPGLVLTDVEVINAEGERDDPLALDELTLAIAPWDSLRDGALRLHGLEAAGLDVTLQRRGRMDWQVSGLLPLPMAVPVGGFLDQLQALPVDRLLLRDARFVLVDAQRDARVELAPVALRWHQMAAGDWRFALDARAGDQRLRGRLDLMVGEAPSAEAVIDFSDIDAARLTALAGLDGTPLRPAAVGRLDGRLWLDLDGEGLVEARGELTGRRLGLLGGGVETAEMTGRWVRSGAGWQAVLQPERVLDARGQLQSMGAIGLGQTGRDGAPIRVSARDLPVAPVGEMLNAAVPASLSVAGTVPRLDLVWADRDRWRARAMVESVDARLGDDLVMTGATAEVLAGPAGGRLTVTDLTARTGAGGRLRNPIRAAGLEGGLTWWHDGAGHWRLRAEDWRGDWAGSPLQFDGRAWLMPASPAFVDLNGRLGAMPVETVLDHLPVGLMHEKLTAWLDQAIRGGDLTGATWRLYGPLDAFPFDEDEGLFDLQARLTDINFAFNPDWPPLTDLAGLLRFSNRGMSLAAERGRIDGVALTQARADLPDLWRPRLSVEGRLRGPVADMADMVEASPLLNGQRLPGDPNWQGEADLTLGLRFPFEGRPPEVEGALALDGVALEMAELAITLSDLQGVASFDADGVRWDGLRGRYAGEEVLSQARTEGQGDEARIRVDATTRLALADWPGLTALENRAEGSTRWRLQWEQPGFPALRTGSSGDTRLLVRSDLTGIALDLPLGLDKPPEAAVPGRFEWRTGANGQSAVSLDYGDRLRTRSVSGPDQGARWAIGFGASAPSLPASAGTVVTGDWPVITLADLGALGGAGGTGPASSLPPIRRIDLDVAGLDINRWRVEPLQVTGTPEGEDWVLSLSEGAEGRIEWRPAANQIIADLEAIRLGMRPADARPAEGNRAEASPPDVRVDVDAVTAAGASLGRLAFSREGQNGDAARATLTLNGDVVDLDATVERVSPGLNESRLRFDLYAEDAGVLLTGLGLPAAMRGGQGDASGELTWVGPLLSPVLPTLAGALEVDMRNGALPAVEPGAGRALGLFSLSVLPRRLGLDFSDVVGEGLRFDRLQGTWTARAGQLETDDLTVLGPSLDLSLTGQTDLVRQRYDQAVTVRPQVTSALSFLGGLAGGPAAAVALFLTRGMIESEIDQLTEIRYRIEGPWDDPQLELLTPRGALNGG